MAKFVGKNKRDGYIYIKQLGWIDMVEKITPQELGKIGERIIKVNGPSEKREYKNVIVLTNGKQVKTMYVRTDNELESFLKKYVK